MVVGNSTTLFGVESRARLGGQVRPQNVDDQQFYWLAGWLEGEGSFLAGPPSDHLPRITGVTTDEDVAKRVSALLGVSYWRRERKDTVWKTSFQICLRGSRAVSLMEELHPLMGQRRQEQIGRALAAYKTYKLTQPFRRRNITVIPKEVRHAN